MTSRNSGQSEDVVGVSPGTKALTYPQDFFDVEQDRVRVFELGPQGEPIDEDLRIMELMEDPFFKNAGRPVPQDPYKPLGIGFGPLSGQQFPEACSLRFDPDQPRDPDGKFASGAAEAADKLADENGEIKVGDVFSKPADLKSEGESLELDAATKWEGAVRIADLIPTQPNVDASNVKWQIKNQDKWKPVQVSVGKDGKQYLLDGHNRVIAAALLGHEGVDAVVFEEHGSKRSLNPSQDVRFSPDQPRDPNGKFASGSASASAPNAEGKWDPKTTTTGAFEKYYGAQYPELKEGDKCDGRTVSEDVDNMSSIGASMTNYLILDGVREVDFNKFDMRPDITPRTKDLAEQIKASNEIMPFIVGVDAKGPFIMEGSHRYDAMKILGAQKIPAIVVLDLDELRQDKGERSLRFDPDQPRDHDGKFAGGGGEPTQAIKDAIKGYTAQGGKASSKFPFTTKDRELLTKYVRESKLDHPTTIYRGMWLKDDAALEKWFEAGNTELGHVNTVNELTSFSRDEQRVHAYGSGGTVFVAMAVHAESGADISAHSLYPEEQEVLEADMSWKVTSADFKNGTWYVKGEELKRASRSLRFDPDQPRDPHGEWTSGGFTSGDGDKQGALDKIAALQAKPDYNEGWLKTKDVFSGRLDPVDDDFAAKLGNVDWERVLKESQDPNVPVKDVPTAGLVATQGGVKDWYVKQLIEEDKSGAGRIVIVHNDGVNYVVDGHHHAAAAILEGAKSVKAHYFDAADVPAKRSFKPDQPRDKDGSFSMGNVATFKNEKKGIESFVTKYNGKFHVNLMGGNVPQIPSAIYSDKEKAVAKAKELAEVRFSEDQPRDPSGKWTSSSSTVDAPASTHPLSKFTKQAVTEYTHPEHGRIRVSQNLETGHVSAQHTKLVDGKSQTISKISGKEKVDAYLNKLSVRFDPNQPRDPDGKFASGGDVPAGMEPIAEAVNYLRERLDAHNSVSKDKFVEAKIVGSWAVQDPNRMPDRGGKTSDVDLMIEAKGQPTYGNDKTHWGFAGKLEKEFEKKFGRELHLNVEKVLGGAKSVSIWKAKSDERSFRFSPDQPRDPNGEFASGGGETKVLDQPAPEDNKEYKGESKAPNGKEGHFSAEKGGLLFHGTGRTLPGGKFKAGETYTAVEYNETHAFAKGEIPGAGGGPHPWVVLAEAKPGKTLDVNAAFSDMIENGDPFTDEPKIFSDARAAGARYVTFDHPSSVGEGTFKAIVSLYPDKDLKSTGGYSLRSELRFDPDQPRDPDGKFSGGSEMMALHDEIKDSPDRLKLGRGSPDYEKERVFNKQDSKMRELAKMIMREAKASEKLTAREKSEVVSQCKHSIKQLDKIKDELESGVKDGSSLSRAVADQEGPLMNLHVQALITQNESGSPMKWAKAKQEEVDDLARMNEELKKSGQRDFNPDQPRDPDGKFASGGSTPTDVIEHLNENHPVNPENDKERLLMVGGKRVGSFEVTENGSRLRIKSIVADEPGQGVGSLILSRITNAADKAGVTLELTASSKGSQHLDTDQLKDWYGKHGFVVEPGSDPAYGYMIREPKAKRSAELGPQGELIELRYSEDQPRDPDGKFASGGGESAQEKPKEVQQIEALQLKMRELENKAADLETKGRPNGIQELNDIANEHAAVYKQIQELEKTPAVKEWSAKQEAQRSDEHKAEVEKAVAREAKEQNYERVQVLSKDESAYPEGFKVGGFDFNAGGYADLTSGMVTIISSGVSVDYVPSIMAHEIEHERFQAALNAYNSEHHALMSIPGPALFGEVGVPGAGILMASGAVRPEYQSRYPATTLLQKSLEQDKFKLYDSDGCTKYSEAYWKNYNDNGRKSADGERAMHETLAEMARVKVTTGKFPEASNVGWRDLYRAVDKLTKSGNAIWPNGLSPKHYQTGEGE